MIARLNRLLARFGRSRRGAITVEFAFLATVGVVILFSGFEFGRYVLISTKFDRAVTSIGDMVTQNSEVTNSDLSEIFNAGQKIIAPYSLGNNGVVIVSEVTAKQKDDPWIIWQAKGVGTASDASPTGNQGEKAKLPASLTLDAGESVVVVELTYKYTPLLFDLLAGSSDLYRVSYHRPRKSESVELIP
jgi:Flp pilus assembly protein TadG